MTAGPRSRVAASAAMSWLVRLRRLVAAGRRSIGRADPEVGVVLGAVARETGRTDLRVIGRPGSGTRTAVLVLGARPGAPEFVAKVARSDVTAAELQAEAAALAALGADPRLAPLIGKVPAAVAHGEAEGGPFLVQTHLGGPDGRTAEHADVDPADALICAGKLVSQVHRLTSYPTILSEEDARRIVGYRVDAAVASGRLVVARRHRVAVEHLVDELHRSLAGRRTRVSWIHGDLWLGNLVLDGSGRGCGLIDWGGIQFAGLPGIDVAHLILTTRAFVAGRELGAVVADALVSPSWSDAEESLLGACCDFGADDVSRRTLVLLSWLHHITSLAPHWTGSAGRWLWTSRNVDTVLEGL